MTTTEKTKKTSKKTKRRDSIEGADPRGGVSKRSRADEELSFGVTLSTTDKAPQVVLSEKRLTASNEKGYRGVRATHPVSDGSWRFEVQVRQVDRTQVHTRIGWCTEKADLQTPVGFDAFGFCYRDIADRAYPAEVAPFPGSAASVRPSEGAADGPEASAESAPGSVFHCSRGRRYGCAYGPGDTIGCFISLPSDGEEADSTSEKLHPKGSIVDMEMCLEKGGKQHPLEKHPGAFIAFTKNGHYLGKAFVDIPKGNYYPAVALFQGATVTFNFGPKFAHPAPDELQGFFPISNLKQPSFAEPSTDILTESIMGAITGDAEENPGSSELKNGDISQDAEPNDLSPESEPQSEVKHAPSCIDEADSERTAVQEEPAVEVLSEMV